VRLGSLVRLANHFTPSSHKVLGVVISMQNEVSLVQVWWMQAPTYPSYISPEELEVIAL
jgi:hypothetical protein